MGGYRVRRPVVGGKRCANLGVTRVPGTGSGQRAAIALSVAALTLAFAGCSSSGEQPELGQGGTVASTVGQPATTLVTQSSTSSTQSVDTTSTAASTTTTIDQRAKAQADVRAAVTAAITAFRDCLGELPACDVGTLEATRRGDLLRINSERINEWNSKGYAIRNAETFRFVIEAVDLGADSTTATALVCIADGTTLVSPGTGPGGADVIVDDSYVSGRELWDVRLDPDGVWRPYAAPASGSTEARDVCPAG